MGTSIGLASQYAQDQQACPRGQPACGHPSEREGTAVERSIPPASPDAIISVRLHSGASMSSDTSGQPSEFARRNGITMKTSQSQPFQSSHLYVREGRAVGADIGTACADARSQQDDRLQSVDLSVPKRSAVDIGRFQLQPCRQGITWYLKSQAIRKASKRLSQRAR